MFRFIHRDVAKSKTGANFIKNMIEGGIRSGKSDGIVATRFPPEPNGYLHIGHSKSIWLNFTIAEEFNGTCNLRFDDTNPEKEDVEFENAIKEDVEWLGYKWSGLYYASDYYDKFYECAIELIKQGKAYVCELTAEQTREYRGKLGEAGKESPFRNRSVEENLELFEKMRKGDVEEGKAILRAKIDMASPNMNMRDPAIYRVKKLKHHRTGDAWPIYPMYDFSHCISDALEGITNSLCTLEFEDHRPLYDWFLDQLQPLVNHKHPQQTEFSKLKLTYNIVGKRDLRRLIEEKHVDGWDDPRLPTLRALRRRGVSPRAIRGLSEQVGVTKKESVIDMGTFEAIIRDDLNVHAPRAMCVLDPVKVTITNWDASKTEELEAPSHPNNEEMGVRKLKFSKTVYLEREDFEEVPPEGFRRLIPGGEVRLRYAYIIKCEEVIKDASGKVTELKCSYDPDTRSGTGTSTKKVSGVIHWVGEGDCEKATVRIYDRLFSAEFPGKAHDGDYLKDLNPDSLYVFDNALVEKSIANTKPEQQYQFERHGYFVADRVDTKPGQLVFNRVVTLKDGWKK